MAMKKVRVRGKHKNRRDHPWKGGVKRPRDIPPRVI